MTSYFDNYVVTSIFHGYHALNFWGYWWPKKVSHYQNDQKIVLDRIKICEW